MAILGCGEYEAFVLTRGGASIVSRVEWSALAWSRVLDDTSEASVTVDAECIESISGARPWRHELSIHRDGTQVWVGPIVTISSPDASDHLVYQIQARGITAWWDHRLIHLEHDYSASPTDASTVFKAYSDDAMLPDNTPGLIVLPTLSGSLISPVVLGGQFVNAGVTLRDLARSTVDWVEIGREVICGGTTIPTAQIGIFRDEHFVVPPKPTLDGLDQTNHWVVVGEGNGESGAAIYGIDEDSASRDADGLLESSDVVSSITSTPEAVAAAATRLALTNSDVITIQGAQLGPNAPVDIAELIPGAIATLDLEETLLRVPVKDDFRLFDIEINVDAENETIVLNLQPIGST